MIDRRIFKFANAKKVLLVLAGLTGIQAIIIVLQGLFLSTTLTGLWNMWPLQQVLLPLVIFAGAFVMRQLLGVAKNYVLAPFADNATNELQEALIKKYTKLGPSVIAKHGTGKSVVLAVEGIDQVHDYFSLVLIKLFDMSIIPWVILAYLTTLQWKEAVFLFAIYPVIVLFMILLGFTAQAKADKEYDRFNRLSNHFIDTLRGLTTLKQLGLSKKYANNIYEVSEDYRKATIGTLKIAILSSFALDFFTTLSIAIVALFLGMSLMNGTLMLLPALTMLVLAPDYFLPIRNFANDYHATLNGKNALADIFTILDMPEPEGQETYQPTNGQWQKDSTLSLKHVDFKYDDGSENALSDISLDMTGYQRVGLVGTSGSGKSTLLNLIGGFLNGNGQIAIDGQDVPHLAQKNWQHMLQVMPQDPYIFHETVRENLAFYATDASDTDIIAAIETVGLRSWFDGLPEGLDTVIGEGALQTSGGQAQRIGLARIILDTQRHVILLDEPTAHLDIETEYRLKETMLPVFEDKLVVFATHRLHWLAQMDNIIVMRDGKIVEQGTLPELMAANGYFVELQAAMRGVAND
ncbi:thiol reductant ABC exporter subunit CydD [Weissella ceti]|uniref:Thiol reductant ABC exporter subunit CydD n=1 Tax=Weissella ceti TaxID=759620 RepID=A0ABT3E2H7_9LACO|nr:thiol reductant ABC exporter subunit CydD [Weissella ceti]MCW0952619.1 thiol reductant ABC exporter subunit CydD [Weissella ceti]QVK12324.1 thiol reductant ABC exporter subunit CydD [Weissella ceti]